MTNQAKQASLDGIIARTNKALKGANLPTQERAMLQNMYEQRILQLEQENEHLSLLLKTHEQKKGLIFKKRLTLEEAEAQRR